MGKLVRTIPVALLVATTLLLASAGPASAGTLDQEQTGHNFGYALLTSQSVAQTFTAGISGGLDQVDLLLERAGTPPDVTVEIRNASAGKPGTGVLATASIPASAIGSNFLTSVTFATPAPVMAGTQYAMVISSPGTVTNDFVQDLVGVLSYCQSCVPGGGEDVYPSGAIFVNLPPSPGWAELDGDDLAFKTYVLPEPPTPPPPTPPPPTPPNGQTIAPPTCKGIAATIVGTDGPDQIAGTVAADVIAALGGNDTVTALAANDVVCGGPGKDTLNGGKGNDKLYGEKGKDTLKGGGGKDLCKGGKGKDTASKCEVEKSI